MLRTTRVAAVVMALSLGLMGVTACSSGGDSGSGDLVTAFGGEPQNPLIPTNTNENLGGRIVDRLFAGLMSYDADGHASNEVADSITSTDNVLFDIKIKPDWKFTDGTTVKSHNFVDAWNYGALSTNAQLQQSFFAPIEGYDEVSAKTPTAQTMSGLKVVSDTEFTVKLKAPSIDFKTALAFTPFYPLPDAAFKDMKAFGQSPIGNGPYKLEAADAWQHNVKLNVVTNPDYHGNRVPKNKGISFVFYAKSEAAYSDLQGNNLDLLEILPPSALATYKTDLGDRAIQKTTGNNQTLDIPFRLAHFSGEEGTLRRQAISLAINREQITNQIFKDTRVPSKEFTASSLPGYDSSIPGNDVLSYNPEKAKQLWAQADAISPWSGTFKVAYNSDGGHQEWVDAVSNSLRNTLGIDAQGAPYPTFAQIRTQVTNRTIDTAFRAGWQGDYPSLLNFLEPLFVTGAGSNDTVYSNPEFDATVLKAEQAPSADQAEKIANQAQAILLKDLPVIPLWFYNNVGGHSTNVSNVSLTWNALPDYENVVKG